MAKIPAESITLNRAEGRTSELVGPKTVHGGADSVWDRANALLRSWSQSAPKDGSYHKTDFVVTYADGETYEGRYDLVHFTVERPDIADHMRAFVMLMAGLRKPSHMTDEQYERYLANWSESDREKYREFLDRYQIGDEDESVSRASSASEGRSQGVYIGPDIWNDDEMRRTVFAWISRTGMGPTFGSMSIGYYQQLVVAAIEVLEDAAKAAGIAAPARFRVKDGMVQAQRDDGKWIGLGLSPRAVNDAADRRTR